MQVLSIATDYRDFRKSGFQEYAVVNDFNAVRLPQELYAPRAAAVGVAFVAAAISLGVCLGLILSHKRNSHLDLLSLARVQGRKDMPEDIVGEVFDALDAQNRPVAGDWILIYGGKVLAT
jgi:NADPH:quinone reductase-like Zn-dependent oxidoreductase